MAVESWQSERIRVAALNELGRMYQRRDLADTAILHGWPVASLQSQIMRELAPDNRPITEIGLTPKEKMQYSVLAGLRWCGTRPEKLDGLEGEGSRAIAAKIGREPMPGEPFNLGWAGISPITGRGGLIRWGCSCSPCAMGNWPI